MTDVFLSYNREDQAVARRFAQAFEALGYKVWWDVGLRTGEAYDQVTEKALREAKAVVVLWSKRSVDSRWVRAEATLADRNKTLLPVMVEPCERPIMFELTQTADLSHWRGDTADPAWRNFRADVKRYVDKGAPSFAAPPAASSAADRSAEPVLAVLAFDNLSGDPEMSFFSDGVSDEILQTVSRGLRTIGRSSSFQFRGADKAVRNVASALGATHVLDGSVRRGAGVVRVSAQLIEAQSQTAIWQSQFDRPEIDLFAVQDEIAAAVASALNCRLTLVPHAGDIDPSTHELFLRARELSFKQLVVERRQIDMADEVTRRAPNFGPGWVEAGRARVSARLSIARTREERRAMFAEAGVAVERATALLGPDDPALASLVVDMHPWCGAWTKCEARLRRALQGAPHVISLNLTLGTILLHTGRMSEAGGVFHDIYEREPLQARFANQYALALHGQGRLDEQIAVLESACRRWPDAITPWSLLVTSAASAMRWDIVDAWTAPERLSRLRPHEQAVQATLARIGAVRDPTPERRESVFARLKDTLNQSGRLDVLDIASASELCDIDALYALLDRVSFAHLTDPQEGAVSGTLALFWMRARRLRADPRFPVLCARFGLVQHWLETDRWPDCADERLPYDFRDAARAAKDTPLG